MSRMHFTEKCALDKHSKILYIYFSLRYFSKGCLDS